MTDKKQNKIPFEEAFKKLESIVESLEAGDLTLEQSTTLFEEGMQLLHVCGNRLDETELKIKKLIRDSEDQLHIDDFTL